MIVTRRLRCAVVVLGGLAYGPPLAGQDVSFGDVLRLKARPADARIEYGPGPQQFGELWIPAARGPHPVAIVIHGGCWQAEYGEAHIRPVCAALAKAGVAAWCVEYRRVGDEGGGWPGTFEDVARAADHLASIASSHDLDLARVVAVGHSAGGHLALWLAARSRLPAGDPLRGPHPLAVRGVVALAPIPDLARASGDQVCGNAVAQLMGGPPEARRDQYAEASPASLLPLGVPQTIVHGRADRIVPIAHSESYASLAMARHDRVLVVPVDGAGHFDLIAPFSPAWSRVQQAVRDMVK
jgi:acetyl esterase/lipase